MIKAIFFDLDGTLLNNKKKLLPSTKAALRQCKDNGIKLFAATARTPMLDKQLGWIKEELDLFDGGIFCNGACEKVDDKKEYTFLNPDVVKFCVDQVNRYPDVHISLHLEEEVHAFNHPLPDEFLDFWGLYREQVTVLNQDILPRTIKILIYYDHMMEMAKILPGEIYPQIKKTCGDKANVFFTDGGKVIQVTNKKVSKYTSIEKVRAKLGLKEEEVAVFGDDVNDIEMLSHYKNSVAMGNALDSVKEIASFVTNTNEEDGIYMALKNILSII